MTINYTNEIKIFKKDCNNQLFTPSYRLYNEKIFSEKLL